MHDYGDRIAKEDSSLVGKKVKNERRGKKSSLMSLLHNSSRAGGCFWVVLKCCAEAGSNQFEGQILLSLSIPSI